MEFEGKYGKTVKLSGTKDRGIFDGAVCTEKYCHFFECDKMSGTVFNIYACFNGGRYEI